MNKLDEALIDWYHDYLIELQRCSKLRPGEACTLAKSALMLFIDFFFIEKENIEYLFSMLEKFSQGGFIGQRYLAFSSNRLFLQIIEEELEDKAPVPDEVRDFLTEPNFSV